MEYVKRIAPGAKQADLAKAAGVTGPTVSRWMSGSQGVDPQAAAKLARAYDRPVLEAFVAAEFLTAAEAKVRPAPAPDFTQLTNDELLELVRARMEQGGGRDERPASNTPPGSGPDDDLTDKRDKRKRTFPVPVDEAARDDGKPKK